MAPTRPTTGPRQGEDLTSRVSGLERDMQHTLHMIEQTNRTVDEGFAETRRMIIDMEQRSEQRSTALQGSILEAEQRHEQRSVALQTEMGNVKESTLKSHQISWPTVISIVSLVWLVILAIVAWGLTQSKDTAVAKTRGEITETALVKLDTTLQREMTLADQTLRAETRALDARLQQEMRLRSETSDFQISDAHYEIEKLHTKAEESIRDRGDIRSHISALEARLSQAEEELDRRWPEVLEGARSRGTTDQLLENIRETIKCHLGNLKQADKPCPPGEEH